MPDSRLLPRSFYNRPTLEVARDLLGQRLVRLDGRGQNAVRLAGQIVETEAYIGEQDLACHARFGRTPRTAVMYGPPGHAYVYFTYGMHWMLNVVTEQEDFPAAVLIRALIPSEGIELVSVRRKGRPRAHWMDGPGKICQSFAIDGRLNGADLCDTTGELFVEWNQPVPDSTVTISARVGLNNVPEPWKSIPWRFQLNRRSE